MLLLFPRKKMLLFIIPIFFPFFNLSIGVSDPSTSTLSYALSLFKTALGFGIVQFGCLTQGVFNKTYSIELLSKLQVN
jgi:hypothetical protein